MAVSYPEMVKSMVVVNSGPELVLRSWRLRCSFLRRRLIVRTLGMKKMAEFIAERIFPEKGQEALREEMTNRWAQNDRKAYYNTLRALPGWSVAEYLGGIDCPTLVISADQDYTPVSYKRAYVSKMPKAELAVVSDSRHATPMDQPEKFNKLVADFLKRVEDQPDRKIA
jgi:pimeloyl-ACP methyl ester carboxylesterase